MIYKGTLTREQKKKFRKSGFLVQRPNWNIFPSRVLFPVSPDGVHIEYGVYDFVDGCLYIHYGKKIGKQLCPHFWQAMKGQRAELLLFWRACAAECTLQAQIKKNKLARVPKIFVRPKVSSKYKDQTWREMLLRHKSVCEVLQKSLQASEMF